MNTSHLLCLLAAVAWTSICSVTTQSLPAYFKVCSRNDPNFRECAVNNGQDIIPYIVHGDPELNIPNMVPLKVADIPIDEFQFILKDVEIYGLDEAILRDWNVVLDKQNLSFSLLLPNCVILGDFTGNRSIAGFDIDRDGQFNLTLDNLDLNMSIPYDLVTKDDGKEYMVIKDNTEITLNVAMAHFNLENFSDDEDLVRLINEFFDDSWQNLIDTATPNISKVLSDTLREILSYPLNKVPFDDFFLEN